MVWGEVPNFPEGEIASTSLPLSRLTVRAGIL